jgi:hypothetical protein
MKTGRGWLIAIAVILVLGGASVREAWACHRFSDWRYPFPQRCRVSPHPGVRLVALVQPEAPTPPPEKPLGALDWGGEPLWTAIAWRIPVMGD